MSGSQFLTLADAAGYRGLMTRSAPDIVVYGSQAILQRFALIENEFVVFKGTVRHRICGTFNNGSTFHSETVVQIINPGIQRRRWSLGSTSTLDETRNGYCQDE